MPLSLPQFPVFVAHNIKKFHAQSSVLRLVFDCSRVQTEQLFCPQRCNRPFCLGRVSEYTPVAKNPAPCCDQNWLIPSARANSSSRTATLVRRSGSARENPKERSSFSVLLCLKFTQPDRGNCGAWGGSPRKEVHALALSLHSPSLDRTGAGWNTVLLNSCSFRL